MNRRSRRQSNSIFDSAMRRGASSDRFGAVVGVGFGCVILTYVLDRYFGVDKGLTVVVVVAFGLAALLVYHRRSAKQAKRDIEEKRAEFFDQFSTDESDKARHGK